MPCLKIHFQTGKALQIFISRVHTGLIVPLAKGLVTAWVNSRGNPRPWYISFVGMLAIQHVGYAFAHWFMHRPKIYWWTHKYHHRFNEKTFVRPISANAVTLAEFVIAYVFPIVAGIMICRPSARVADAIITIISFTNLLIHTPESVLPTKWVPDWFVTNKKHFYHHEKDVKKYYSAPIFDIDRLVGLAA